MRLGGDRLTGLGGAACDMGAHDFELVGQSRQQFGRDLVEHRIQARGDPVTRRETAFAAGRAILHQGEIGRMHALDPAEHLGSFALHDRQRDRIAAEMREQRSE